MGNSDKGRELILAHDEAAIALRRLDPETYEKVHYWLDSELYGGLYGLRGADRLPPRHKGPIVNLLRARAGIYRGRKNGDVQEFEGRTYDSESGNEMMAQAIENCLQFLGEGPELPKNPPGWDDFLPDWYA